MAVDLSRARRAATPCGRVVEAQELERKRLARELHDETGQALTSILLGLKPLEQTRRATTARAAVAALRELVVATLQDVRRLAVELRPSALDDFGLVPALERLVETFREQPAIARRAARRSSATSGCRPRSRRRSTASCRRRSRTSSKHADATRVSILS